MSPYRHENHRDLIANAVKRGCSVGLAFIPTERKAIGYARVTRGGITKGEEERNSRRCCTDDVTCN